jgi:CysZ protein
MISAFLLAFGQLSDKSLRRVVWIGLFGSLAILFVVWFSIGFTLFKSDFFATGWLFGVFDWLIEKLTAMFGGVFIIIVTWFIFPSVATLIISFFLEDAVLAVERKYYPGLPATRVQSLKVIVQITLKFTALSIGLNILTLPIYARFFFLGPLNLFVFYILNGYLLGREYFELIAHRRLGPLEVTHLRQTCKVKIFLAGMIITFLMTVPIINLVTPVVATAAMVHLVQRWHNTIVSS